MKNKKQIQAKSWTTKNELDYLNRIGKSHVEVKKRTSRKELLTRYIAACLKRTNWDGLNEEKIFFAANQLLSKCK